jgi:WD40 repeat protein
VQSTHDIYQEVKPVLWDSSTGRELKFDWLNEWLTATFSTATQELLTVKSDGSIAVWDEGDLALANPQPKIRFPAKPGRWWATMSPDGRRVAAIEGNQITLLDRNAPESAPRILQGHVGDIKTVRFSRDGQSLVTASTDRTARVWRVDQRRAAARVRATGRGHSAVLFSAVFNNDGRRVATSSADKAIPDLGCAERT